MLALVILTVLFLLSGALLIEFSKPHGTPQERLAGDPDLLSACQSEYWTNTSHEGVVITREGSHKAMLSTLNRVCYYRDGNVTITSRGDYEGWASAFVSDSFNYGGSTRTQVVK
jgi:hypothetical protein